VNQYLYDAEGRICAAENLTTGQITGYLYDAGCPMSAAADVG